MRAEAKNAQCCWGGGLHALYYMRNEGMGEMMKDLRGLDGGGGRKP